MKKGIYFLILSMLAYTSVYAEEPQNEGMPTEESKYFRVYFGPDVFLNILAGTSLIGFKKSMPSLAQLLVG